MTIQKLGKIASACGLQLGVGYPFTITLGTDIIFNGTKGEAKMFLIGYSKAYALVKEAKEKAEVIAVYAARIERTYNAYRMNANIRDSLFRVKNNILNAVVNIHNL